MLQSIYLWKTKSANIFFEVNSLCILKYIGGVALRSVELRIMLIFSLLRQVNIAVSLNFPFFLLPIYIPALSCFNITVINIFIIVIILIIIKNWQFFRINFIKGLNIILRINRNSEKKNRMSATYILIKLILLFISKDMYKK